MCGIFGTYGIPTSADGFARLEAVLAHRGPDAAGSFHSNFQGSHIALGHRRLSIIDVGDQSNQPMRSRNLILTYNGEVYNYRELRAELEAIGVTFRTSGDTEVILEGWRRWGPGLLPKLRGMFAFAIADLDSGELFLARDPFGIKPLWYSLPNTGKSIAFASELKALRLADTSLRDVDSMGVCANLVYMWVPDEYSIIKGAYKLPPGSYARFHPQTGLEIDYYFRPETLLGRPRELGDADLGAILRDAVHDHMTADVPVGTFLSGGLDSSLITAIAKERSENINCFTIRWPEDEVAKEGSGDDLYFARRLANEKGLNLTEVYVDSDISDDLQKMSEIFDEPIGDPAAINVYKMCTRAREMGIKVLLSGMGADELFGGYRRHMGSVLARYYRALPGPVRGLNEALIRSFPVAGDSGGIVLLRWLKRFISLSRYDEESAYRQSYSYFDEHDFAAISNRRFDHQWERLTRSHARIYWGGDAGSDFESIVDRMCLADIQLFLPGLNLAYTDRASMAASVEVRVPFVDCKVAQAAFAARPRQRIGYVNQKVCLKKIAKEWLPEYITFRPKASFGLPLRTWTRTKLLPMINDLLPSGKLVEYGIINKALLHNIIDQNRSGANDFAHVLWNLMALELWYRKHSAPASIEL